MLNSTFMLSLRAAAAGSTAILAAAVAQPALAQGNAKSVTSAPPMLGDVKSAANHLAKEPTDPSRMQTVAAGVAAQANKAAAVPQARMQQDSGGFSVANLIDQPIYDVAADGSIWARGRTYKAHFAAEGFTYIPFHGGAAPRSFPVTFSIDSIEVAGVAMSLVQPTVTREGDRITINRGGVVETYVLTAESVEQLFVFNNQPATGEAKINLNVRSEMSGSRQGDAFAFANEFGSVSYTDAIAVDAAANRAAAPTKMIDGRKIEISVPASVMTGSAYPLTIDPVLSTFTLNAPEGTGTSDGKPDIAYDASVDKWMLVWEENFSGTDGDIYTMFCDANGTPTAGTLATVNGDGGNARNPRIANNRGDSAFFVAYEKGDAPSRKIFGRSRANSGFAVGAEFQISDNAFAGDHHSPDVGGDPNLVGPTFFCVTWQRDFSATDTDVLARLADAVTNANHGGTILVANTSNTLDRSPAISNTNSTNPGVDQNWIIAWEHQFSVSDRDIYGMQILWDGTVTLPAYDIDASGTDDRNPTVSTMHQNSMQYLVAYEENNAFIYGRVMQDDDVVAGANITALEGATPAEHAWAPTADAIDGKFVLAYQQTTPGWVDTDTFVSTLCASSGTLKIAESHRRLAMTNLNEDQLQIASAYATGESVGNRDVVAVWTRHASGAHGEVRGAKYGGPITCCRADVAPVGGDGQINVADLLAVINQWGQGYDASANVNGDAFVNVADLLAVIAGWGPCS